ncbi:(2Fe-2S)-binding protein [Crossiella sp. NPDC003009]
MTVRLAPSALAASLAGVDTSRGHLTVRFGTPDDSWRVCADLLADPAQFDRWRKDLAIWLNDHYDGNVPDRTTAGYVLAWYLQVPAYLGAILFHTARRVPWLRPGDLAFRLSGDRPHPDGIALLSAGFVCLPEDPAAGTPEATVVRDEAALAGVLRARFAGHAREFVAAYGPTTRLGRHMLWGAATDALDSALWQTGRMLGDEGAGVAEAALVLPALVEPFTSASRLYPVHGEGRTVWTRRRESCCFHFALDGQSACATCPRVSAAEREKRVLADS